jgi:hypothetical protein
MSRIGSKTAAICLIALASGPFFTSALRILWIRGHDAVERSPHLYRPDPYHAAIQNAEVQGVVTARGEYRTELTLIRRHRLWMQRGA